MFQQTNECFNKLLIVLAVNETSVYSIWTWVLVPNCPSCTKESPYDFLFQDNHFATAHTGCMQQTTIPH